MQMKNKEVNKLEGHGTVAKNLPTNAQDARDMDSIPGSGRYPRLGNGNLLQHSCLEKSMDRGVWLGPLQSMGLQRV